MTYRLARLFLPCALLSLVFSEALHAQELCSYTARISARDKLTQSGKRLMMSPNKKGALASLQMDRANFHRFRKQDPEDTTDCLFANINERQKMETYGNNLVIPASLLDKLWQGEPVLRVQIYRNRLEISEATPEVPAKPEVVATPKEATPPAGPEAPVAGPTQAPAVLKPPSKSASLVEHEETARALLTLRRDTELQRAFQQAIGPNHYALCAAMVADIEQGLGKGHYELSEQQLAIYAGVAAGMIFLKQHLISNGTAAPALEQAVSNAQQRAPSGPTVYDQCYQAMRPVYSVIRQIR